MNHKQDRNAINDFYAKRLCCDDVLLRKRNTFVVQIEQAERPEYPFLAVDNGVAQVFSVTETLCNALKETLFWCIHGTHGKVDIHDYVFFNETLWPKLREGMPLERWYKGILLYCTGKWLRQSSSPYEVLRMTEEERHAQKKRSWPRETYRISKQLMNPDGDSGEVNSPISFASVRTHGESKLVVTIEIGTRPEFRRQGMAKAVIAYTTKQVLDSGRIPLYGTAHDNFGSLATARSVGYRKYGKILGFRA